MRVPSLDSVDRPAVSAPTGVRAVGAILLILALSAAVSVDVVKAGYGNKGDEATYVSMALSVAFDHDLSYQRRDLERYWGLYRFGPNGIFLKRGEQWHVRLTGRPPFVHLNRSADARTDRVSFGKALIYPVAVAPFVRVLGLNGFLVFHVLLLFGIGVCGYYFLATRAKPATALTFTLAFILATVVPIYAVFLTSDLFNLALVFFAYFFWLYKEVAPAEGFRMLRGLGSDILAAVLIGMAAYSKVLPAALIGPIVLLFWWRRRYRDGVIVALAFAAVTAGLFGVNAFTTGEFNYQGGDRRTFYSEFPLDSPQDTWDHLVEVHHGVEMTTNDSDADNVLDRSEFLNRFEHNVEYFFIGRHFGFVPYFFPGVIALLLWLASDRRFEAWRVLSFLALAGSTVALLVFFPYTWSGGGGPPGNRYFLSLYPVLFFLIPSVSIGAALLAWLGGALFTAHMLLNPFVAAKFPNQPTERGLARRLPVELTMANDLPVALDVSRAHVPYEEDPTVLLYFLDEHAYIPDQKVPAGQRSFWISGSGRADIIVRTEQPLDHLVITADSPIRTVFTVSLGGARQTAQVVPGMPVTVSVPAVGVRGLKSYAYLLSAQSSEAFTPRLQEPGSTDDRNLGVHVSMKAVLSTPR